MKEIETPSSRLVYREEDFVYMTPCFETIMYWGGPIFERAIPGDWAPHLATMHDFWSSVMLTSGRYKGNPVAVHLRVEGIEPRLFARWLALFDETCRELFDDDAADAFRAKAERIAESLKLALFYRPDRPWQRSAP